MAASFHAKSSMCVPYPRPQKLSDPFHDNTPQSLRQLLAKADADLAWGDYHTLLGPFVPAGTYEETLYFLPLAFDYVVAHEEDALDLCTSLTWYCSEYADRLRRDALLDQSREMLAALLKHWTSRFRVVHFDAEGCRDKGWRLQYFDYVQNREVVAQTLEDLVRFERHTDLAEAFIHELALAATATEAAWLLELARSQDDVYPLPNPASIREPLNDPDNLLNAHAKVSAELVLGEKSPTYWKDVFKALGL